MSTKTRQVLIYLGIITDGPKPSWRSMVFLCGGFVLMTQGITLLLDDGKDPGGWARVTLGMVILIIHGVFSSRHHKEHIE
ncbi:hypothetical protein KEM60_00474 [Austwickia sp. TVS 96-490-7B]|uniref:hypothetical protein n=1 Tax=Austwickia sp. TVS 96-490-7B TaxID=2830843 RepID=UPI001C58BD65|nr:hypothetical protein [Austwickia sp. TVS 96-490-7B]MBW3084287.1 hypothetical protein [Austwickia sp. TVS 96-490-7B]